MTLRSQFFFAAEVIPSPHRYVPQSPEVRTYVRTYSNTRVLEYAVLVASQLLEYAFMMITTS
jgi:hypothetical protein